MHDFDREPAELRKSAGRKREPGRDRKSLGFASEAGNRAIQRLLDSGGHRSGSVDSVQRKVDGQRGGGETISPSARSSAERALKSDFSDVRIHRDTTADGLSRSLKAKAFTTGNDIFFKSGAYDPGSTAGQKLLAHELTHVFQQRTAGRVENKISDPHDASETEAHQVADAIAGHEDAELAGVGEAAAGISLEEDDDEAAALEEEEAE